MTDMPYEEMMRRLNDIAWCREDDAQTLRRAECDDLAVIADGDVSALKQAIRLLKELHETAEHLAIAELIEQRKDEPVVITLDELLKEDKDVEG